MYRMEIMYSVWNTGKCNVIELSEQAFFDRIKNECKIIFDIGCREDTWYIEHSFNKIFYVFEPYPEFLDNFKKNLGKIKIPTNNLVYMNDFGLGSKTEMREYFVDSQSFFVRKSYPYQSSLSHLFLVRRFREYLDDMDIKNIDFLKIDVEGCEAEILFDDVEFIKNKVKYIQFEYANTWTDKGETRMLEDVIKTFYNFNFSFLYDPGHPFAHLNENLLTEIDTNAISEIEATKEKGHYGLNIIMERK